MNEFTQSLMDNLLVYGFHCCVQQTYHTTDTSIVWFDIPVLLLLSTPILMSGRKKHSQQTIWIIIYIYRTILMLSTRNAINSLLLKVHNEIWKIPEGEGFSLSH